MPHPDEQAKWEEHEKQRLAEEQRQRDDEEKRRRWVSPHRSRVLLPQIFRGSDVQCGNTKGYKRAVRARKLREEAKQAGLTLPVIPVMVAQPGQTRRQAICKHCGTITRDWAMSSGDVARCVCMGCRQQGHGPDGL